jgi:cobalt-zinc-cadmium efflux system membrane fusion protein
LTAILPAQLLMLGLCLSAAAATDGGEAPEVKVTAEQLHQLEIMPAAPRAFTALRSAIGQIAFNEDASTTVFTPFSGRVTRLLKRVGDEVARGEPLFEIDSPEVVQAQTDLIAALQTVDKATSQAGLASRVLDRQTALFKDKATAQRDVDQARNDQAAAQSELAIAQGTLAAARNRLRVFVGRDAQEIDRLERERVVNPLIAVNAPIAGTVVSRKVGPGQFVRTDAAEPLYAIADLSTMWLKAYVPEGDIPYIRVGQKVDVAVLALPDRKFTARILAIGAASDQQTRRIVVRSEIPNPDGILKADMFVTFRIATGEPALAPAVPTASVIREGENSSVWVEREPLVFLRRKVELGVEEDGYVQIRKGLRPGERVVGRGAIFVDNEMK